MTSVSQLPIAGISPDGPPHLDAGALVLWRETVLAMNGLGILARADASLLEGFVVSMARAREAGADVRKRGMSFTEQVVARNGDSYTRTTNKFDGACGAGCARVDAPVRGRARTHPDVASSPPRRRVDP